MTRTIKIAKSFCLYATAFIMVFCNTVNYFYFYKELGDIALQWKLAMFWITSTLFLMSMYIWLDQTLKRGKTNLSGWMAIFLFVNMVGVLAGYNLHTKGFMMLLFVLVFFGGCHLIIKLWQRYYF